MNYEKQTWATGDVITAEKLNHMEDGIAGDEENKFIVNITDNGDSTYSSDKTAKEIYEANESGMTPVAIFYNKEYPAYLIDHDRGYVVGFHDSVWNSNRREVTEISVQTNNAGTTTEVRVAFLVGELVPSHDVTDAGKVLKVETPGQAPVWGEAGGVIIATYTMDPQTSKFSCDMTYDDIAGHITNGELVIGYIMGSFVIPVLTPEEHTLTYTINSYAISTIGGEFTLNVTISELIHYHVPEDPEAISTEFNNIHWKVLPTV